VSKQDTHFFNVFSLVLGILVGIAILLFVLARLTGAATQGEHLKIDALQVAAVEARTKPLGHVAVAGQDNAALEIKQPAAAAGAGPALTDGEGVYNAACIACHGAGIAGAPKFADRAAWGPRISKGLDTLHKHAIEGFHGTAGVMPPKGGRVDIADDLIRQAVDYMVDHSK
jgi:cytochrome c5